MDQNPVLMMEAMPESEERLLKGARQLDEDTLASIYDAYSSALFRYAVRLLGNPEVAEEVVSETFFRFLKSIGAGGGPKKYLKAYLYRIAHNLIVDQYRRNSVVEVEFETEMLGHVDSQEGPAHQAEISLAQLEIRKKLWALTEDQRQVIVLKYLEGLNNQEIAEILGKPVGAVKSLQHRGLNSLRRMLAKDEINGSSEDDRI